MDELNIGVRKAVVGEPGGAIDNLNFKDHMMGGTETVNWWSSCLLNTGPKKHKN